MKIIAKYRCIGISEKKKEKTLNRPTLPILKEEYSLRFLLRFDSFVYTVCFFFIYEYNANSLKSTEARCISRYTLGHIECSTRRPSIYFKSLYFILLS